jgi:hypothetical protein
MPTILKTKNSVTTTVAPTTLQQGELAVNITDKKMWVGNAATTPVQILGAGTTGTAAGSNTQVQYNSSGTLAGDADFTFNGTTVTMANDASISGLTVGKGGGAVAQNTAFGASALISNTSGNYNVGVGVSALGSNTTGNQNNAVGYALITNTTGSSNNAFGTNALRLNTTGTNNSAFGEGALDKNTIASNNTAVGYQAGYSGTTGADNVHLGYRAGYSRTTGAGNTIVGDSAGYSLTTGHANTFVGAGQYSTNGAGYYVTTGSNNTVLGGYDGNQGGLDIRTSSGYVVLSDGAGNPIFKAQNNASWALQGAGVVGGIGITFPATQSASSDANTLDDYEEGSWTPSVGGNATYSTQIGTYTKIGNLVFIRGEMSITTRGTGSAQSIGGLPFSAGPESTISISKLVSSSFSFYSAQLRNSGTELYLSGQDGLDGTITVNQNFMQNGTEIQFSGVYRV